MSFVGLPCKPIFLSVGDYYDVDRFDDEFDVIAGLLYLWLATVICG